MFDVACHLQSTLSKGQNQNFNQIHNFANLHFTKEHDFDINDSNPKNPIKTGGFRYSKVDNLSFQSKSS